MFTGRFGYRGENGADRLAKSQKSHTSIHKDLADPLGTGRVTRGSSEPRGSGNIPTILLKTAAQVRREAAGEAAGAGRALSILPKSEAYVRREAVAKIRAKEEADAILRRAVDAQVKAAADARAAEVTRKAAEAEQVRRATQAAAALQVRRAAFDKACKRVVTVKAALPGAAISVTAQHVFAYVALQYADAGNRPVKVPASSVAYALDIKETAAREALDGLQRLGWLVSVTDSFGTVKLMPSTAAAASVQIEGATS